MREHSPATRRERQSLADLFHEFADLPSECVVYDNGYRSWTYTYAQVGRAARGFAARLHAQGVRPGDKVVFWSENRPEWIAAFWGCVLAGAVVVPVDYRSSAPFLRRVQETVAARLILIGEEVRLPSWPGQPPVWPLSHLDWSAEAAPAPAVRLARDDVAEIVFTSGATGEPKGVVITHGNILANIASPAEIIARYRKWFRPLFPLRFLSLVPLSHMFGQTFTLFILPLIPGVAVFMRGYSPLEILRQVRLRRVSVVVAVPRLLDMLRHQMVRRFPEAAELSAAPSHWLWRWWRYRHVHASLGWKFWAFIVGAAPLPAELEAFWSRLGFAVIQGYGLTETAPVVAFNNPFAIAPGTVGRPIAGMEVRIAPDGEILVRGESLTPGYYRPSGEVVPAAENGWFHTGDLGELDAAGHLRIRGRKKETIVTPEGLNVVPEDVERVLNETPGVRESAVVGRDRVHAVLVLRDGARPEEVVRLANSRLEDHQQIRGFSLWPGDRLPRTEGTQKLKRGEILAWVERGGAAAAAPSAAGGVLELVRRYAPDRTITPETTLGELGLSSLDRVELLIALEQQLDTSVDESLLAPGRRLSELAEITAAPAATRFPAWSRRWPARLVRNVALAVFWLPLTRLVARTRVSGRDRLASLRGPVVFAPNHRSHLDTPLLLSALPARYRYRLAVAMWQEYFDARFAPQRHTRLQWLRDSVLYSLVALFFNAFPLPQTEAGARQSLRYIGDLLGEGWSVLFFPEGQRTEAGIAPFQPGIGLIAGRLRVPIVPVRLLGTERILPRNAWRPRPGRAEVIFGEPLYLEGEDYAALARQVEQAVRRLGESDSAAVTEPAGTR